jgi:hypothetical protein
MLELWSVSPRQNRKGKEIVSLEDTDVVGDILGPDYPAA